MNKTLYNEAVADIATALGLIDKVSKLAYSEFEYKGTRKACGYVIKELVNLEERFSIEWERDERFDDVPELR